MWLPDGWWIITEVTNKGVRFTAGANGLPEIESSAKFRSDREATSMARKALRSMSYENQDSGWSKFRCHARLPGQTKAFCGARIEDSPNTKHAYSEQCGKCERIVESIPDPAEAENDIKKYFRTRTAFSEWLRGLETEAKARVYKAAVDQLADSMAAGAWQDGPAPKDGSWILGLFHGLPYVVVYDSWEVSEEGGPKETEEGWCLAGQDMHPMDKDEPEKWARIIHPDRHMPASWDGPGDRS